MTAKLEHVYNVRISEVLGGRRSLKVVAHTSIDAQAIAAEYLDAHEAPFTCQITSARLVKKLVVVTR